jgi:hypothetical protein
VPVVSTGVSRDGKCDPLGASNMSQCAASKWADKKKTGLVNFSLIDVAVERTPNVLKQVHYKIISLLLLLLFSVFDEKQPANEGQTIRLVTEFF